MAQRAGSLTLVLLLLAVAACDVARSGAPVPPSSSAPPAVGAPVVAAPAVTVPAVAAPAVTVPAAAAPAVVAPIIAGSPATPPHTGGTASAAPTAPRSLVDARSRVVIAGLLQFSDPSLSAFAAADRRDVELGVALVARGVPSTQITTLLDAQATRAAVLRALVAAADATPPGGTLVFYYAGHGLRTAAGEIAYVAYDTRTDDSANTGLTLSALHQELAARVAGKHVLLLGDCCHSGGLGLLAARLAAVGATAFSLTSADASNLSTGNWTYSQVLIEGLRGDAALDANSDARVDLAELEARVRAAMRYREGQLSGADLSRVDASALTVAPREGPPREGALAGQFMRDRHGQVVRVNRVDGPSASVRRYLYALSRDSLAPLAELSPIHVATYPVGSELMVEWGGREWPAVVTAREGDFAFITYPGWPHYWDEWILPDRVRRVVRLAQ